MKQNSKGNKKTKPKNNPLPIILIGLGGLLIIIIAVFLLKGNSQSDFEPQVNGAPALAVDHEMIDFGDVKLGETVEAAFVLTNVGDQPLRILEKPYIEVLEGC